MKFAKTLLRTIGTLLTSKKFLVAVLTAGAGVAIKDPATRDRVIAIGSAFILGQGIADHGKAAAEINAANDGAGQ